MKQGGVYRCGNDIFFVTRITDQHIYMIKSGEMAAYKYPIDDEIFAKFVKFRNDESVVQDWVSICCTWKQQTVLLAGLRGCDGLPKHDPSKQFTKKMRAVLLKNADPTSSFMPCGEGEESIADFFIDCSRGGLDAYPVHWLMHFLQAAEIIGYKHPDEETRAYWIHFYLAGVTALHLNPESEEQLDKRLVDKA